MEIKVEKKSPKELKHEVYTLKRKSAFLFPTLSIIFLLIGFLINFPVKKNIDKFISNITKLSAKCHVQYKSLDTSALTLKIKLNNISFSPGCPHAVHFMGMKNFSTSFRGISFSPLGIKLLSQVELENDTSIPIQSSLGVKSFKVILDEVIIPGKYIPQFSTQKIKLFGEFEINAIVRGSFKEVKYMNVKLNSKNITLPKQNIGGFDTPKLDLSPAEVLFEMKKPQEVNLKSFQLGKDDGHIKVSIDGDIKLNKKIQSSILDLNGKMKLSSDLLNEFSIATLFLGPAKEEGEYYHFSLSGKLARPSLKVKNK